MDDTVYNFMKLRNRPYSLNDIVSNLHNEFGKSAVQKSLDKLVEKGKVFVKAYGKQKIYCPVQDTTQSIEELMRIDNELQAHANELEKQCQQLEIEIKTQEGLLESMKSSITIDQAREQKPALENRVQILSNKLDNLMDASDNEDLHKKKEDLGNALKMYSREYAKRKRLCTDILDCILDNYPGSKTEVFEEIGIEFRSINK